MNRPEDRLQARVRMFLQTALPAPGTAPIREAVLVVAG